MGVNVTFGGSLSSSSSIAFFSSGLVSGFVTLLNVNGWELEQFRSHLVRTAKMTRCKQTKLTLKMRKETPFTDSKMEIVWELKQHTEKMFEPFCHLAC